MENDDGGDLDLVLGPFADLGFGLLSTIWGEGDRGTGPDNVFLSPPSVALVLAMLRNGARGRTREALDRVLGVGDPDSGELDRACRRLLVSMEDQDPNVEVRAASGIWCHQDHPLDDDFVALCRDHFGAEASNLDLGDPGSLDKINDWVRERTGGRIGPIFPALPAGAVLCIANTIYFKGQWKRTFAREATAPGDFHLPGGGTRTVPMMRQTETFGHMEGPGFQAVRMDYDYGKLGMYVLLPDEGTGPSSVLARMSHRTWREWLPAFGDRPGTVGLPRFKIDFSESLREVLTELGMGPALDPGRADLGGLHQGGPPVHVSDIRHGTCLLVDENGTEAAAATGAMVEGEAEEREEPFHFWVDRPFLCLIADRDSGVILFVGAVTDPEPLPDAGGGR